MAKVIKSSKAEQDLVEIWKYIAEDNEANADKFLGLIQKKCLLLSDNPLVGTVRSDLARHLRSHPIGHYLIFYRPIHAGIELVRILHAGRDVDVLF